MRFRSNSVLYEKVSEDATETPEDKRTPPTSSGRRPESWLCSRTVSTILVAVVTAIVTALLSTLILSRHTTHTSQPSTTNATSTNTTSTNATSTIATSTIATSTIATPAPIATPLKNAASLSIKGCGSSPEEARNLGCVYDVMMQDWTPEECYDSALTEKYLANNNWTWWADSNAERAMSDEEVALGEHDVVYVAQDYHVKHCIFAWEKFVRAFRNQEPLITELISYDHVLHCRDHTILPALDRSKNIRGVVAPTGFTHCASYDIWINALPENEHSSVD